eukprot:COSAG06_NODE_371_length_16707_cov_57.805576_10_plen_320_part_00
MSTGDLAPCRSIQSRIDIFRRIFAGCATGLLYVLRILLTLAAAHTYCSRPGVETAAAEPMMLDATGGGLTLVEDNPASSDGTQPQDDDDGEVPLPDYFRGVRRLLLAAPTPTTELPLQAELRGGNSGSLSSGKPELTLAGTVIKALLVAWPVCFGLFGAGAGERGLAALVAGNTLLGACDIGITLWVLAGGLPAFSSLSIALGPSGHLSRLGGAAARLPATTVADLNWWRRVIRGVQSVLMFVFGAFIALFAIIAAAAGDTTVVVALFVFGAVVILFFWITCAFWLSLKVAGALVLHPANREFNLSQQAPAMHQPRLTS